MSTSSSSSSVIEILSTTKVSRLGGMLHRCKHASTSTKTDMIFAIFLPSIYYHKKKNDDDDQLLHVATIIPAIYWLSGLTCTDENFCQKAGSVAFAKADEKGIAMIMPDTSPRGESVANNEAYDLGQGAGFYINATQDPWKEHYQMYDYISEELPKLAQDEWNVGTNGMKSICGHSMGGHGALTIAFKQAADAAASRVTTSSKQQQKEWVSVSALAPICHPTACPWGKKVFENYLGSVDAGKAHDATLLLQQQQQQEGNSKFFDDILIDEGTSDNFGQAGQLLLEDFEAAAQKVGQKLTVRRQEGFGHDYYFIAAFISDHIEFHSERLLLRAAAAATTTAK